MRVLGIIPARGGSKGVQGKNIRIIAGKPLIQYTIDACKNCQKLSDFVVSTDSDQIKKIVEKTGTKVVDRPPELGLDTSSVVDAALHVLENVEDKNNPFDAIMLLQPTSPIRTGEDIDKAIDLLNTVLDIDGVISVIQVDDNHPARMYLVNEKGYLESFLPVFEETRRQDLPNVYHRNGSIYLVRRDFLINNRTFMPKKKAALIMPSDFHINIDNEQDVLLAEIVINEWKKSKKKK